MRQAGTAAASAVRFALAPLAFAAVLAAAIAACAQSPHGELDADCAVCHDTESWEVARQPAGFDHARVGFPLVGGHADLVCRQCHRDLVFAHIGTACADCHPDAHRGALGADCERCHQPGGWDDRGGMIERHAGLAFPLLGAHAWVDCGACHRGQPGEEYTRIPTDCVSCHLEDYQGASDPDHASAGFPTACQECHTVYAVAWEASSFRHPASFPLTGAHARARCGSCHASGYAGTPADCYACHRSDYEATADPDHSAAGFSTDCATCHSTAGWEPAGYAHPASFPLTGGHASPSCVACHAGGYAGTPADCYACHQNDYDATSDPNHLAAGFPTDCVTCHSTAAWEPAVFEHPVSFPLTGGHASPSCVACHAGGYAGTPTECFACHQDDYDATSDPNHAAAGFPTDCLTCHSTVAWEPSTFDHAAVFPLTGAHASASCLACHAGGYAGTPTDCFACHQDDYDATSYPNHLAAGFPTDCAACHSTVAWEPSTWDHDLLFPIYTGKHREAWNVCADCHVQANDYSVFECIFCHEHNQADTDDDHSEVGGYAYESGACFTCHPRGESD